MDPKIIELEEEGSPSILHLTSNEAATGIVCREQGCMQRKLWESLQSPTDCNTEFWMAEVLPVFQPAKCKDAHALVLATHSVVLATVLNEIQHCLKNAHPSTYHTIDSFIDVFPDSALNLYLQDR